ncbi:futalosine hydrolase [Mucilaginibacter jinjuensis]|uniref:Futalosine hydrolase n=1 Tax=Mucilaginibacter jinjuensis TaxID=1176721 RepID=A0ABY7T717_9SPHI|nr:futalosine hydrolase [Mucilaginibacter jinjuensis]WCT12054.1 futalosine hydrolase [Mucilaginibacter jinjuensis]
MHILIVAATEAEISLLRESHLKESQESRSKNQDEDRKRTTDNRQLDFLITGVGMTATAYALGTHLVTNKYDLVINLGIAGSFDRSIALGDVVEIIEDTFSELGAEDDDCFLSLTTLGFGEITYKPNGHPFLNIKQVKAITVNKVHGNEASIDKIVERLNPQLESMEGAAVFYACRQAGVACVQIRAVSNYVEKRNRDAWKIGLAVKNLNTFAGEMLRVMGSQLPDA